MNTKHNIKDLLPHYLGGELTIEERKVVEEWISANKENLKSFLQAKHIWESASLTQDYKANVEDRWNNFQEKQIESKKGPHYFTRFLKIAASFLIFFLLGITTYHFIYQSKQKTIEGLTNRVVAPYGSKTALTLTDGTEVWLNAGSKLEYPDIFMLKDTREVRLEGEAYFNIAKNENKPFLVHAQGVTVKAIGTAFNVKAYVDEPTVEAILVEGVISVSTKQNKLKEIILKPKQKVTIDKSSAQYSLQSARKKTNKKITEPEDTKIEHESIKIASDVETNVYTSWKDAQWIIQNETLDKLAKKLERRYAVNIAFKDTLLKHFSFTGTLYDESLEQVLEVISVAAPIKFKVNGNNVVLEEDERLKHKYNSFHETN